MSNEKPPIPGTWGAVVRSETPMPWRRMLKELTFTEEEFVRDPAGTVVRIIKRVDAFVRER